MVVFANLSATLFSPNLVAPFVNKQLSTADSVLQVQTRHLSSLLTTVSQSPTKRRPEKSVKKIHSIIIIVRKVQSLLTRSLFSPKRLPAAGAVRYFV